MGLRLGGLASGLDTQALIDAIMGAERRPVTLLQQQVTDLKTQKGLIGDLEGKLTTLRNAAAALDNLGSTFSGPSLDEELLAFTATSSNEDSVRATATGSASPGAVSVRVLGLAATARRVSGAFASDTAAVAAAGDTLDIAFGGGTLSITVGASGASLVDLRGLINNDPANDGSVRADVLFDGTGYRLVVRGTETGAANDVTLTTSIAGPGGASFLDAAPSQSASDASLEVFGLTVTRPTNTITDLLPGVTLELRATSATPVEVSLETNVDPAVAKLEAFAKAYNDLTDFVARQSDFDTEKKTSGPFAADSSVRLLMSRLQRTFFSDRQGNAYAFGSFHGLADIGVKLDKDGHLSVDRAAYEKALTADPTAVRGLLGADPAKPGVASEVAQQIDDLVKSHKDPTSQIELALLPVRKTAIDDRVKSIEAQISDLEDRLTKREALLVQQFSRMESLLTQLRQQGSALSGFTTLTPSSRSA